jgi:hypothetical protein
MKAKHDLSTKRITEAHGVLEMLRLDALEAFLELKYSEDEIVIRRELVASGGSSAVGLTRPEPNVDLREATADWSANFNCGI